jgi:two-component system, LytTR family, sensor kinase
MTESPNPEAAAERRLRRRGIALVGLFFVVDGLLRTGYFHFGARARGLGLPFLDSLISELTGSLAAAVVFFLVALPAARRWPLRGPRLARHLAAHAIGLLVFSTTKTLLMWGTRSVLFPIAGLGAYEYGAMSYRFTMEFSNDVVVYALFVAGVHAWDAWRATRDRELREARLQASLTTARLQALQAQLQPHFLFNTMNVISSVMYTDPEQADRLMSRLSDLLRTSLAAPQRPEVPIEEELRVLDEYVEIMRARFGDRLTVTTVVQPSARGARVPVFLLQPLVENAIHHGIAKRSGAGCIEVRAERDGESLVIRVLDDGPGLASGLVASTGIGLANTRERLRHLHGAAASLEVCNRATGGAESVVRLPFVLAEPAGESGARMQAMEATHV